MFQSFEDAFNGLAGRETAHEAARLLLAHAAKYDVNADVPFASLMLQTVIWMHNEKDDCGGEVLCGGDLVNSIEAMQSFLQSKVFAGEKWNPSIDGKKWAKAAKAVGVA